MRVFYSNLADSYIRNNMEKPLDKKIYTVIKCVGKDLCKRYIKIYDDLLLWMLKVLNEIPEFKVLAAELEKANVIVTKTPLSVENATNINGVAFYWDGFPYIIIEETDVIDEVESILIHEICHFVVRHFAQINKVELADEEEIVTKMEKVLHKEIYMQSGKAAQKIEEILYDTKNAS